MINTVLVLGAGGRLGRVLVQSFADAGWTVLAQSRRHLPDVLRPLVRPINCPIEDLETLTASAAGAGIVIHALNPLYTNWTTELVPLARAAVQTARRLGARLMFPGNVYNFGSGMPELLREDTAQRPDTRKGEIRRHVESCLRSKAEAGVPVTVLRAGDFFGGPGTGSWFDLAIAKDLTHGKIVYPGPLDTPHAWAYLPDLGRAFVALAERQPAEPFETFHFAGHTLTGRELTSSLVEAATQGGLLRPDQKVKIAGLPWPLLRAGGLFVPMWAELAEMRYLWNTPHRLDGTRLAAAIGTPQHTPLVTALGDALRALGKIDIMPATLASAA